MGVQNGGDAEVCNLDEVRSGQENVCGLEIAMDDAIGMQDTEAFEELD